MKQKYYYIDGQAIYCGKIVENYGGSDHELSYVHISKDTGNIVLVRNADETRLLDFRPFNGESMSVPFVFKWSFEVIKIITNLIKAETEKLYTHILKTGNNNKLIHYVIIRNWIYPFEIDMKSEKNNEYVDGYYFINDKLERGRFSQNTVFANLQEAVKKLMVTISKT